MSSKNEEKAEKRDDKFKFVALNQSDKETEAENKPIEKMFGFLRVRDIGVTKTNVLTMLLLEFCAMLALQWHSVY